MSVARSCPLLLDGNRLILTPLTVEFCTDKYLSWLNDPEVFLHLDSGGNYSMQDLREFVMNNARKDVLFWAIIVKQNNNHIGNIKIDKIDKKELHGEYGIMIGDKSVWGKGYGREASEMVINYCFQCFGLKAIHLGVNSENMSAINLYKSLGFKIMATELGVGKNKNNYIHRMTLFNK